VAISIDATTALRGVHDLQRLVEAVIDADEHDELDWVEWKGTLDLSTKAGCFHVVGMGRKNMRMCIPARLVLRSVFR
jgi:hypothetical protein